MKTENEEKQDRLLTELLERFRAEAGGYADFGRPAGKENQRRALRSLMNVRMPRPLDAETLELQDEYLRSRARERGVVRAEDIPTLAAAYGAKGPLAEKISLWQGDITRLGVDAIVNAANSQMLGCFVPMHACIDNCIHTFAGVQLRRACYERMEALRGQFGPDYEQPTAVPLLTDGYNLPARKVIHVVGPIVEDRVTLRAEAELAACYTNTLNMCREEGLRTVAFCCISTGVFRFPNARAAEIAVRTVSDWLAAYGETMDRVIFNVFLDRDREIYEKRLGA